jgi:hypothetical protein
MKVCTCYCLGPLCMQDLPPAVQSIREPLNLQRQQWKHSHESKQCRHPVSTQQGVSQCRHPEGTQMLGKVRGWQCQWPVAIWSMRLCLRKDLEQVLETHKPGALINCGWLLERHVMMLIELECHLHCCTGIWIKINLHGTSQANPPQSWHPP